jgi:hypothetical protein
MNYTNLIDEEIPTKKIMLRTFPVCPALSVDELY